MKGDEMNQLPVTEQELQAYVDDALPAARRLEIDAYLQARPAEAARIDAYREQNRALHALFDPILLEPVAPRLAAPSFPAANPLENRAANTSHWRQFAACAIFLLTGGIAGWLLHGSITTPLTAQNQPDNGSGSGSATVPALVSAEDNALARHAAIAHATFSPEARHPVEVGADQEAHLVAWLSKSLGTQLRPPKLTPLGYDLIGGRLLPGDDGPVAQFMYQDHDGMRITLYVSTEQTAKHETGFRFSQEGGVSVFYWIDGKFGYALSGNITKPALGKIADTVYRQLEQAS
jgi:anti-sigma factor RsiW